MISFRQYTELLGRLINCENMKTGILLSGGMDSIALIYWKKPDIAFTVDYGQKSAEGEIRVSSHVCRLLEIPHEIISVNCKELGSGDLSGTPALKIAPASEWWPFRNQLLLTLVGMKAVSQEIKSLIFGSVKTDAFHKDGSREFFEAINRIFAVQEGSLIIEVPAIDLTTTELIQHSGIPRSLLLWSLSCHVSDYACGRCRGCIKHYSVLKELGYETD